MKTSARVLRTINKLRARASRDSQAMTANYADRLDAEARAMGYDKWGDFLRGAVRSETISGIKRLVTVGGIAGRHAFVDAAFAQDLQDGRIDDEVEAYARFVAETIDVPGLAAACAIPAAAWDGDLARREAMSSSLWIGPAGQDRLIQSVAELAAAMMGVVARLAVRGEHDLVPPLWRGRAPSVHALRDAVMQSRAHAVMDGSIPDGEAAQAHAEEWWKAMSEAIEEHHPLGISSGARHLLKPHEDGMRRAVEDLLVDRLGQACRHASSPMPPDPEMLRTARREFESAVAARLVAREGVSPKAASRRGRAELEAFLSEMDVGFGDPAWSWTSAMARSLADLSGS
jgi:hypothetical protein